MFFFFYVKENTWKFVVFFFFSLYFLILNTQQFSLMYFGLCAVRKLTVEFLKPIIIKNGELMI